MMDIEKAKEILEQATERERIYLTLFEAWQSLMVTNNDIATRNRLTELVIAHYRVLDMKVDQSSAMDLMFQAFVGGIDFYNQLTNLKLENK